MRIVATPISPDKPLNFRQIVDALDNVLKVSEQRLVKEHEKIVANWNEKPAFDSHIFLGGNDVFITVRPTGGEGAKHWHWVSRGTGNLGVKQKGAGYMIYPSGWPAGAAKPIGKPQALHYVHTYVPKTSGIGPGYKSGGPGAYTCDEVFASAEEHFGIKPRHFEEGIRSRANLWWQKSVREAINAAVDKL